MPRAFLITNRRYNDLSPTPKDSDDNATNTSDNDTVSGKSKIFNLILIESKFSHVIPNSQCNKFESIFSTTVCAQQLFRARRKGYSSGVQHIAYLSHHTRLPTFTVC